MRSVLLFAAVLALAAELNHYPGPRHALELAHGLELSPDQVREIERIREAMSQEARRLGEMIIEQERQLDGAFARATIDEVTLRRLTDEIARAHGVLRFAHLRAHLQMRALLSVDQVSRYDALRAYRR
jgi:Spy/CpxP family protein refolding chaperone